MRRRRLMLLVLGLTGLALLGTGFVVWVTNNKHRVTLDSALAVEVGMSLAEVEVLLGRASEGEPTRRVWTPDPSAGWYIEVVFDNQGRVLDSMLVRTTARVEMPEGVLARFRRWLGL